MNNLRRGLMIKRLFFLFLFFNCTSVFSAKQEPKIFQVSTINAILDGVFEGDMTYRELMKHGDFGLGTFNDINGEMVALDGRYYQYLPNGRLKAVDPSDKVPFARVTFFKPTDHFILRNREGYNNINKSVERHLSNTNIFYAVKIQGIFNEITVRILRPFSKPYPKLSEAKKDQYEFTLHNVKGTAVGFWSPSYLEGLVIPKLHLHFITSDYRTGGHVLDLSIDKANVLLMPVSTFEVALPKTETFKKAQLHKDHDVVKEVQ